MSETGRSSESAVPVEREAAEIELSNDDSVSDRAEKLREEGIERLSAKEVRSELGL